MSEHETSMLPPPPEEPTARDHEVPSQPPELDPRNTQAPSGIIEAISELRAARAELRLDREQAQKEREETRRMQQEILDGWKLFYSETGAFGASAVLQRNIDKNVRLTLAQMKTIRARQNAFEARLAEGDMRFDEHDERFGEHDGRLKSLEADKAACEKRHAAIEAEIAALKARGNPPEPPGAEPSGEADAPA
jgi:DNA repair exonuclease SbcCD ATPase subunit